MFFPKPTFSKTPAGSLSTTRALDTGRRVKIGPPVELEVSRGKTFATYKLYISPRSRVCFVKHFEIHHHARVGVSEDVAVCHGCKADDRQG